MDLMQGEERKYPTECEQGLVHYDRLNHDCCRERVALLKVLEEAKKVSCGQCQEPLSDAICVYLRLVAEIAAARDEQRERIKKSQERRHSSDER